MPSTAPFDTRYSGGGTNFVRSQSTLHIHKGAMLSHPSRLYHAGNMLTSGNCFLSLLATFYLEEYIILRYTFFLLLFIGKRYILVGFVKVRSDALTTVCRRY